MIPHRRLLPGKQWHFQHGPIDVVIGAEGEPAAIDRSHSMAWERFQTVLEELVSELHRLREPTTQTSILNGRIARRMLAACRPHSDCFITPMAAVAGAVAQELIAYYEGVGVRRAWVNNGGDIAFHLSAGESLRVGLFVDLGAFDPVTGVQLDGDFAVHAGQAVRGIATSGWRGRSFSLGIADSVTVLARTAAEADAAATMIANAVNVEDPRIVRRPASELKDDTDLRDLPVTVDVPNLDAATVRAALRTGQDRARNLRARGLIASALLVCQKWYATLEQDPVPINGPARAPWIFA